MQYIQFIQCHYIDVFLDKIQREIMTCHIKHKPSMFETRFIVDIHARYLQYHIFVTYFFLTFGRKQLTQCLHCIKSTSTTLRGDSYRTRGHIESISLIMSDRIANGKNDFIPGFFTGSYLSFATSCLFHKGFKKVCGSFYFFIICFQFNYHTVSKRKFARLQV